MFQGLDRLLSGKLGSEMNRTPGLFFGCQSTTETSGSGYPVSLLSFFGGPLRTFASIKYQTVFWGSQDDSLAWLQVPPRRLRTRSRTKWLRIVHPAEVISVMDQPAMPFAQPGLRSPNAGTRVEKVTGGPVLICCWASLSFYP